MWLADFSATWGGASQERDAFRKLEQKDFVYWVNKSYVNDLNRFSAGRFFHGFRASLVFALTHDGLAATFVSFARDQEQNARWNDNHDNADNSKTPGAGQA